MKHSESEVKQQNLSAGSSLARLVLVTLSCAALLATFAFFGREPGVPMRGPPVTVTPFVMSKCPDATGCEATFLKVLEQVNSLTELRTEYIGRLDRNATYGVQCMHGDAECYGRHDPAVLRHSENCPGSRG